MRRGNWKVACTAATVHPTSTAVRNYTPIWSEAERKDVAGALRSRDEVAALAPNPFVVPDVASGVTAWLRFRNDPVLHTQLHNSSNNNKTTSSSPWDSIEDYVGTNLVYPHSREHLRDGVQHWTEYYEKKFLAALRQSRRTAANHIGTMRAPDTFLDEADRPETTWAQDTYFKEVAFLAERALKEKVANLEQFEVAMKRADAEAVIKFHDVFATQTQTLIPVPTLSLWAYEGERRKAWVEKFKPLDTEAQEFFTKKVRTAIGGGGSKWEDIAKDVASVFREVAKIQVARLDRQLAKGIRKSWTGLSDEEKLKQTLAEAQTEARSFIDGDFDAEDSLDASEEWLNEQSQINALLQAPIKAYGFSADELWRHAIRREAYSTEHVYADSRSLNVAAASRGRLYDMGVTASQILEGMAQSVERSTIDLRSATLIPFMNPIWCRLHWSKFGSGSVLVQSTTTARRVLNYHHVEGEKLIAALATYYFNTKPLSSALDYSTPYKYRRSMVAQCAKYGVEYTYATQQPIFGSAVNVGRGEKVVGAVVSTIAGLLGSIRREQQMAVAQRNAKNTVPVTQVTVRPSDPAAAEGADESQWAFGSTRAVEVQWPIPAIHALQRNPGSNAAEHVARIAELGSKGFIHVSLQRKRSKQDRTAALQNLSVEQTKARSEWDKLMVSLPQLKEIEASARRTFGELTGKSSELEGLTFDALWQQGTLSARRALEGTSPSSNNTPAADSAGPAAADVSGSSSSSSSSDEWWEYVTTLDNAHPLTQDGVIRVHLPFTSTTTTSGADATTSLLSTGVYRLHVRCFQLEDNSGADPTLSSEAFSAPFQSFDAVPQLAQSYFKVQNVESELKAFEGASLIPFCELLRDTANLEIPTMFEFDVGQNVSLGGKVYWEDFVARLREGKYTQIATRDRFTTPQRDAEWRVRAHWGLYNPGATDEEWSLVRKRELDFAFDAAAEKEWWVPDPMLNSSSSSSNNSVAPQDLQLTNLNFSLRYANDVCRVLSASNAKPNDDHVAVRATVTGGGELTQLDVDSAKVKQRGWDLKTLLKETTGAIQGAQNRLNTLAAARTGELTKAAQALPMLAQHSFDFGGRHGRTYQYAFDKARTAIDNHTTLVDDTLLREKIVDRYASSTNPDQRRVTFTKSPTDATGMPRVDPDPSTINNWGNSL